MHACPRHLGAWDSPPASTRCTQVTSHAHIPPSLECSYTCVSVAIRDSLNSYRSRPYRVAPSCRISPAASSSSPNQRCKAHSPLRGKLRRLGPWGKLGRFPMRKNCIKRVRTCMPTTSWSLEGTSMRSGLTDVRGAEGQLRRRTYV